MGRGHKHEHIYRHCDYYTESAKWAFSVKRKYTFSYKNAIIVGPFKSVEIVAPISLQSNTALAHCAEAVSTLWGGSVIRVTPLVQTCDMGEKTIPVLAH